MFLMKKARESLPGLFNLQFYFYADASDFLRSEFRLVLRQEVREDPDAVNEP